MSLASFYLAMLLTNWAMYVTSWKQLSCLVFCEDAYLFVCWMCVCLQLRYEQHGWCWQCQYVDQVRVPVVHRSCILMDALGAIVLPGP